jgi:hypothetical protein
MKRIGIAASHIAKDNLLLYNIFVCLLSSLLSLLIFLVSSFSLLAGVALVSYLMRGFMAIDATTGLLRTAFIALAVVVGLINLAAVLANIKLKR